MGSLPPPSIPLIDLSLFIDPSSPSSRQDVSRSLVQACHETGLVYITNHGIPSSRIDEAFTWTRKFYSLSDEKKALAKHREESKIFRGWSSVGKEQVPALEGEKGDVTDWTESYGIGTDDNDEQPNVWAPDSVFPGFRTFVLDFHTECWQVAQNVLHALSIGLGLKDEEFLLKFHEQKENELSLRHYPPIDEESIRSGKLDRLGAHTDFDSFTLLWQDEVGGLEVKDKNGKWIDVPAVEGALVMNIGDVLQRWSNDYLTSTLHRVHLPPLDNSYDSQDGKRKTIPRFSIPYFIVPHKDTVLEPLEGNVGGEDKKYEPVLWADYQREKTEGIFK